MTVQEREAKLQLELEGSTIIGVRMKDWEEDHPSAVSLSLSDGRTLLIVAYDDELQDGGSYSALGFSVSGS